MGKGIKPRRSITRAKVISVAKTKSKARTVTKAKKQTSPGQKMASRKRKRNKLDTREIKIPVKYILDLQELDPKEVSISTLYNFRYSVRAVVLKEHYNLLRKECGRRDTVRAADSPDVIFLGGVANCTPYRRLHLTKCAYTKTKYGGIRGQYGKAFVVVELWAWDWNGYGDLKLDNPMPELRMW
jgi:hypothetical protein